MNFLKYLAINIFNILVRVFPVSTKTGLVRIGNPDENSPVLLTGNYQLTVARLKRALRDLNVYLLVANSRGVNVWCSATGGLFTNHDVISVIKTSGIEEKVNAREVILPQLAATGIEPRVIRQKTGWRSIWGPVYAKDIPEFIKNKNGTTERMRQVGFSFWERIEMSIMWSFPFSLLIAIIAIFFWPDLIWTLIGLVWLISFFIFILFPLFTKLLKISAKAKDFNIVTVFSDFIFIPFILWLSFIIFPVIYSLISSGNGGEFVAKWGIYTFIIVFVINLELKGSTPVYKSSTHEDRFLDIYLDKRKCKVAGFCEKVCPRNCFKVNKKERITTRPKAGQCVHCGACIVQCPFDALYFKNPKGKIIKPEKVRKYKLNLMGKRLTNNRDL